MDLQLHSCQQCSNYVQFILPASFFVQCFQYIWPLNHVKCLACVYADFVEVPQLAHGYRNKYALNPYYVFMAASSSESALIQSSEEVNLVSDTV